MPGPCRFCVTLVHYIILLEVSVPYGDDVPKSTGLLRGQMRLWLGVRFVHPSVLKSQGLLFFLHCSLSSGHILSLAVPSLDDRSCESQPGSSVLAASPGRYSKQRSWCRPGTAFRVYFKGNTFLSCIYFFVYLYACVSMRVYGCECLYTLVPGESG